VPRHAIISTYKLTCDAAIVRGPGVVHLVSGELVARGGNAGAIRALEDDVLTIPPGRAARLCARPAAEVTVFRADPSWAERALALVGCAAPTALPPFFVDRAGSDAARRASRILRELSAGFESGSRSERVRAAARGLELVSLTLEDRSQALGSIVRRPRSSRRDALRAAARELERTSLEDVSLPGFARRVGLSERQVSRLFREEFGKTFREHLVELRLERAKRLLRDTDQAIVDVACETGWGSLAHFNSVFRSRVGTTPSRFRARARADAGIERLGDFAASA
jgi:AraC-like DNA-binding protein